jgi:thiosulfate reductase/polysulfide reductase chain A
MDEVRRSYCGLCHPRCGTLLHFKDDRVVKVTGDPDHPVTRGAVCERSRVMPDHLYHPDRLNYPLKRIGDKGGGQWQKLTWDQALDEVAEKLIALRDRYGCIGVAPS